MGKDPPILSGRGFNRRRIGAIDRQQLLRTPFLPVLVDIHLRPFVRRHPLFDFLQEKAASPFAIALCHHRFLPYLPSPIRKRQDMLPRDLALRPNRLCFDFFRPTQKEKGL